IPMSEGPPVDIVVKWRDGGRCANDAEGREPIPAAAAEGRRPDRDHVDDAIANVVLQHLAHRLRVDGAGKAHEQRRTEDNRSRTHCFSVPCYTCWRRGDAPNRRSGWQEVRPSRQIRDPEAAPACELRLP